MPDTLHFDDFLKPKGNLPEERFPDIDLRDYLNTWIERGKDETCEIEDEALRTNAVRAYVYWQAWDHVFERLTSEPKDQDFPDHSASFSDAQIASYRRRRDRWEDEFWDYKSGVEEDGGESDIRSVSISTRTGY